MNTAAKILLASFVGTTCMTLYSYLLSNTEDEQYREPELLNSLIDRSENLPDVANKEVHPAGWAAHYAVGTSFMMAYKMLCPESLKEPTISKTLLLGGASGALGIAAWRTFFALHDNPPRNNRFGYFRQLFVAHLIFAATSVMTYKLFNSSQQ